MTNSNKKTILTRKWYSLPFLILMSVNMVFTFGCSKNSTSPSSQASELQETGKVEDTGNNNRAVLAGKYCAKLNCIEEHFFANAKYDPNGEYKIGSCHYDIPADGCLAGDILYKGKK